MYVRGKGFLLVIAMQCHVIVSHRSRERERERERGGNQGKEANERKEENHSISITTLYGGLL